MRTGWLTAVEFTLRLREFGLFFAGLPCCSFIWLNRSTSMRSADVPFGDQLKLYIQQANVLLDNWISKYSFFNTNGNVICIACISKLHLSARMCVCVPPLPFLPRIATRTLLLCALCTVRSVHWEIEQPASSTFVHFPYLKWIIRVLQNFVAISIHRLWGSQKESMCDIYIYSGTY